jgi:hypothetical protein
LIKSKYFEISGTSYLEQIQTVRDSPDLPSTFHWTYPAAMASKLAGTAALSNNLGWLELLASPSNANLSSLSKFR